MALAYFQFRNILRKSENCWNTSAILGLFEICFLSKGFCFSTSGTYIGHFYRCYIGRYKLLLLIARHQYYVCCIYCNHNVRCCIVNSRCTFRIHRKSQLYESADATEYTGLANFQMFGEVIRINLKTFTIFLIFIC